MEAAACLWDSTAEVSVVRERRVVGKFEKTLVCFEVGEAGSVVGVVLGNVEERESHWEDAEALNTKMTE
jgi:NADPH-dependent glutamate synthase beta subunit-like oxidoreductase